MGCLNSGEGFTHWFGNIHLSGPCNRACYFCIGQHMMALDPLSTLDTWPLPGIDEFIEKCLERGVREINVTGTNTEPLLYRHTEVLAQYLRDRIPMLQLGLRTNGTLTGRLHLLRYYDKFSVTVCSLYDDVSERMMGGPTPDMVAVLQAARDAGIGLHRIKVNVVLGPENIDEIGHTLSELSHMGIRCVNLREPYGQPHVGNPLPKLLDGAPPDFFVYGMPTWRWPGTVVTYWDVHYCEVESVNLYANGRVSEDYPITRGHDPSGEVLSQIHFPGGRIREQWRNAMKEAG